MGYESVPWAEKVHLGTWKPTMGQGGTLWSSTMCMMIHYGLGRSNMTQGDLPWAREAHSGLGRSTVRLRRPNMGLIRPTGVKKVHHEFYKETMIYRHCLWVRTAPVG